MTRKATIELSIVVLFGSTMMGHAGQTFPFYDPTETITFHDRGPPTVTTTGPTYDFNRHTSSIIVFNNESNNVIPSVPLLSTQPWGDIIQGHNNLSLYGSGYSNNFNQDLTGGLLHIALAPGQSTYAIIEAPPLQVITPEMVFNNVFTDVVDTSRGPRTAIRLHVNPGLGFDVGEAPVLFGYDNIRVIQWMTIPDPSPFYSNTHPPQHLTGQIIDTPPNGYYFPSNGQTATFGDRDVPYPWYPYQYKGLTSQAPGEILSSGDYATYSWEDLPIDPCLHGGNPTVCGSNALEGEELQFQDQVYLVRGDGTNPNDRLYTGLEQDWSDSYNGKFGEITTAASRINDDNRAPAEGSGGITVGRTHVGEPLTTPDLDNYIQQQFNQQMGPSIPETSTWVELMTGFGALALLRLSHWARGLRDK